MHIIFINLIYWTIGLIANATLCAAVCVIVRHAHSTHDVIMYFLFV